MQDLKIPFNRPFLVGKELYYIAQSVLSGHTAGDGLFTHKCQALLENKFGIEKVLLTPSCTAALEMAAILCDIKPGDEVILPSFTFVSTANAFCLRGAKPIFIDIRSDTLNIDEAKIEERISKHTKAIIPVHYAGVACEMDMIMEVAKRHDLFVIEDAAQAMNAKYHDKYLGTIGDMGTYSYHETKNVICGEGGALALNSKKFLERAEIIREKGTNRSQFFRGQIDKYTWVDIGSSYLLSDLLAAFLYAQLENMEIIQERRRQLHQNYINALIPLVNEGKLRLPFLSSGCQTNYHIFYIIVNDGKTRTALMNHLLTKGILAVFHYIPLHLSPMGRNLGYRRGQLPLTESISERLLRLPLFFDLEEKEQKEIINAINDFYK